MPPLRSLCALCALSGPLTALGAEEGRAVPDLAFHGEVGFLGVLSHSIQFGNNGTRLNYLEDGGQDNLFPTLRLEADATWKRHTVKLVWQPIDIRTASVLRSDLQVDETLFTEGTPMDLRYGFTFWRVSWLYDLIKNKEDEFSLGLSFQIRNATIDFSSADGTQRQSYRDIGPVPVLKLRARKQLRKVFIGAEIDGFWAPIKYINGTGSDVEGAILDAAFRMGTPIIGPAEGYVSLRFVGGGAVGTDSTPTTGDGYTRNWIYLVAPTIGVTARIP